MNLRNVKTNSGWVTDQLWNANKVLQTLWFKCGQDSTMTLYLNLSSYMADARIFLLKRMVRHEGKQTSFPLSKPHTNKDIPCGGMRT